MSHPLRFIIVQHHSLLVDTAVLNRENLFFEGHPVVHDVVSIVLQDVFGIHVIFNPQRNAATELNRDEVSLVEVIDIACVKEVNVSLFLARNHKLR